MPADLERAREIAGKLMAEGRKALRRSDGIFVSYKSPATADHARRLGIIAQDKPVTMRQVRLVPLGLAVRDILRLDIARDEVGS